MPKSIIRSLGKSTLRKALALGDIGEFLYRLQSGSWPNTVAERITIIRGLAAQYTPPIFIETGTHLGDTTWGVHDSFEKVYTIEIEPNFAARARRRFRNEPRITVLEGDSARVLKKLMPSINQRALLFLDAHFSGGISGKGNENTPFRAEIAAITSNHVKNHIIVIDDACEFNGQNGYPTQEEVFRKLKAINPSYNVRAENDRIIAAI